MAEFTEKQVLDAIKRIRDAFTDGKIELKDIYLLIKEATEFAELANLPGEEKRALAMRVVKKVLEQTDIPWLPDKLTLPIVGDVGADALIMRFLPSILDLVVDASRGKLALNKADADSTEA